MSLKTPIGKGPIVRVQGTFVHQIARSDSGILSMTGVLQRCDMGPKLRFAVVCSSNMNR